MRILYLTGFNPDPSICRVGEDYYIAVSTFEWFPGVGIYHSKDLKNWRLSISTIKPFKPINMMGIQIQVECGLQHYPILMENFG